MTKLATVSVLLLRLAIGWIFFYAGWSKIITYFTAAKDWTASGFLNNLQGPFAQSFAVLAQNNLIDKLNAWGLLLIGVALLLGVLVRTASFWGIVLMILYYTAQFPPKNAFLVEEHIIYILIFIQLSAVGSGRFWGLDKFIEKSKLLNANKWLLKFLG